MDEQRKYAIPFAATILAARKLNNIIGDRWTAANTRFAPQEFSEVVSLRQLQFDHPILGSRCCIAGNSRTVQQDHSVDGVDKAPRKPGKAEHHSRYVLAMMAMSAEERAAKAAQEEKDEQNLLDWYENCGGKNQKLHPYIEGHMSIRQERGSSARTP